MKRLLWLLAICVALTIPNAVYGRRYPATTVYRFIAVFRTVFEHSYHIGYNRGQRSDCQVVRDILDSDLQTQPEDVKEGFSKYFYQVCLVGVYDKVHGENHYPQLVQQERSIEQRFKNYFLGRQ